MNVIIIEDEPKPLALLESILAARYPKLKIVATSNSVISGVSVIKQYQPDIIFMDVMIKGGTSFDILEQLPNLDAELIFTTSYEKFAVQAFRISAVDYLLKPLEEEEVVQAMEKALHNLHVSASTSHLQLLLSNFKGQHQGEVKIALPTAKGYSFIRPDQIIRCESDNTYTTFFLTDKREILVSKTLKVCEQMLEPLSLIHI